MARRPWQRRLWWGAVTNWSAFAATLLVSFWLMPYLVRILGPAAYGVWAFVEAILAYFTLFDLGIAAGVVRFVARHHIREQHAELNRLVSTCMALFLGLGCLVALGGTVVLPWAVGSLYAVGLSSAEIVLFALLMLGNLALTLPLSIFPAILDGLERFAAKSVVRLLVLVGRTVATVVVLELQPSLVNLGLVLTVANLLEHAGFAYLVWRFLPGVQFRRRHVDRATFQQVRGYSLHAFLALVAGRLSVQSGALIVGACTGSVSVTFFAIALRLVELAKALLRTATNTLTPAISSLESAGHLDTIRHIFTQATRIVLYLIIPIQFGFVIFGESFLLLWLKSPEYAHRSYPVLVLLSSTLSLSLAQSVAARVLYGVGRLKWFARMTLLEGVVNIGLSIVLGQRYGLIGVAWGVAVPNLFLNVWVLHDTVRYLAVGHGTYLQRCWLKPLLAASILPIMWLLPGWPITSWGMLITALASGLVPYAFAVLILEDRLGSFNTGQANSSRRGGQLATSTASHDGR